MHGLRLATAERHQPHTVVRLATAVQVIAVGPGKQDEDSKELVAPNVAVGATVMYSKYSGSEFEVRAIEGPCLGVLQ